MARKERAMSATKSAASVGKRSGSSVMGGASTTNGAAKRTAAGGGTSPGAASSSGGGDRYNREQFASYLNEIAKNIITSDATYMHSMLALNHLLRRPEAESVLDADLKNQARDIWLKVKSCGLQLVDPPLLFGSSVALPADFDLESGQGATDTAG